VTSLPEVELAARADVLGVGGAAAIESGDSVQLALLSARVSRALAFRQHLHDDLAFRIAQRIGELFSD
jgi:hypothetical protein